MATFKRVKRRKAKDIIRKELDQMENGPPNALIEFYELAELEYFYCMEFDDFKEADKRIERDIAEQELWQLED